MKYWPDKLEGNIHAVIKMEVKYPQVSNDEVVCAIQLEWIFLKRASKDTVQAFVGVKKFFGGNYCLIFLQEI